MIHDRGQWQTHIHGAIFSLSDEEKAIRDTARDFMTKEVMSLEPEVLRRERKGSPGSAWTRCASCS